MRPKLEGRTVLIVEDEPLIAMDIALAFSEAGAEVTTTGTLKQATLLVEHDGLAAAIVDHALNEGDTTALRARLKERGIPFVIYTGFTDVPAYGGLLLQKPVKAEVLIAAVEGLLPELVPAPPHKRGFAGSARPYREVAGPQ